MKRKSHTKRLLQISLLMTLALSPELDAGDPPSLKDQSTRAVIRKMTGTDSAFSLFQQGDKAQLFRSMPSINSPSKGLSPEDAVALFSPVVDSFRGLFSVPTDVSQLTPNEIIKMMGPEFRAALLIYLEKKAELIKKQNLTPRTATESSLTPEPVKFSDTDKFLLGSLFNFMSNDEGNAAERMARMKDQSNKTEAIPNTQAHFAEKEINPESVTSEIRLLVTQEKLRLTSSGAINEDVTALFETPDIKDFLNGLKIMANPKNLQALEEKGFLSPSQVSKVVLAYTHSSPVEELRSFLIKFKGIDYLKVALKLTSPQLLEIAKNGFTQLRSLDLGSSTRDSAVAFAIAANPAFKTLRELFYPNRDANFLEKVPPRLPDFTENRITFDAARALLTSDNLKNLEKLDLRGYYYSSAERDELRKLAEARNVKLYISEPTRDIAP